MINIFIYSLYDNIIDKARDYIVLMRFLVSNSIIRDL